MNEYLVTIEIINDVLSGNNLNDTFNKSIMDNEVLNINKIKDITSGVIRYYEQINLILNELVSKKISDKKVHNLIIIGMYEINYTDKPQYAIVNYIVELSYNITKNNKIKSFVNAVLRNYLRNKNELHDKFKENSVFKYSIKKWWIDKLKNDYPNDYNNILETNNNIPKLVLRINNLKTSLESYKKSLETSKINYIEIDNKIILDKNIAPYNLPFFNEGFVSIQNIGAQKLIDMVDIKNGMKILDACCAPGGKMCHILENYSVDIVGIDIDENRIKKVRQNLQRLSLNANLIVADAARLDWWDNKCFDLVIADVPCSASGTIKKNPDIKIHRRVSDIRNFVNKQQEIVINLLNVLKTGGKLLYVTCSIFPEENEKNVLFIKEKYKNIKILKELHIKPDKYYDGFYYCLLEKTN
ncbi:MAG: 16S rRNA (cytosine(967)-C(5))-methyltransferase RsmB [Neisseriaceae bacterium]